MKENSNYGYIDDGNVRIDNGSCCSHSCNSKIQKTINDILKEAPEDMNSFKEVSDEFKKINNNFGNTNETFGNLKDSIEDITKTIDEMKNSCNYFDHHHCDRIFHLLADLKLELNCEYAQRATDFSKLYEKIKKLEVDLKHLELLRVSQLEKTVQNILEAQNDVSDLLKIKKHLKSLNERLTKLEMLSDKMEPGAEEEPNDESNLGSNAAKIEELFKKLES